MPRLDPYSLSTIVYVAARLPALSETFVYRELLGLRARGVPVLAVSVYRPRPFTQDPAITGLAREAFVIYTLQTALAAPIALLRHPLIAAAGLRDALTADHPSLRHRLKHVVQAVMGVAAGWRLRKRKIGAVHCHMANAPATVALYLARTVDAGFSFTGHAADLFVDPVGLGFKLRQADFVACISHWHSAFYAGVAPIDGSRRHLVRCSVAIPPTTQPERQEIVTVARLVAKKGIDLLIEAFATTAPGWTLRILGDGPEWDTLQELAKRHGVADRVVFEGARPHAECLAAIAQAGIFVLPCRTAANHDRDGIPVVLMEAMAAGRPVIAGDLPTIRELIADEETGLLTPTDDVPALAERIARLTGNPALRQTLGDAGRAYVATEFADDVNLDRLIGAFDHHRRAG